MEQQRRVARVLSTIQRTEQVQTNLIQSSTQLRASLRARLFEGIGGTTLNLGECAQIASGGTPSRAEPAYWGGDIPWVTTAEIDYSVIASTAERITSRGLAESSARLFPAGTILIAMYGNGVTRGRVARLGITAAVNQACAAVTATSDVDDRYLYQYLANRYEDLRNLGHGAHQLNLSATLLKRFPIALPTLLQQRAIARMLEAVDAVVATQRREGDGITRTFTSALMHLFRRSA
jgi:type I restriction enzyme S subunit